MAARRTNRPRPPKIDPALPCPHAPGTEDKLRVLRARARANLPLFVEGDQPSQTAESHVLAPEAAEHRRDRTSGLPQVGRALPPGVSYDRHRDRYVVRLNGRLVGYAKRLAGARALIEAALGRLGGAGR